MSRLVLLPVGVLQDAALRETDLRVLAALSTFTRRDGAGAWPAMSTLAAVAGVDVRHARRAIAHLERTGWVRRDLRPGSSSIFAIRVDHTPAELRRLATTTGRAESARPSRPRGAGRSRPSSGIGGRAESAPGAGEICPPPRAELALQTSQVTAQRTSHGAQHLVAPALTLELLPASEPGTARSAVAKAAKQEPKWPHFPAESRRAIGERLARSLHRDLTSAEIARCNKAFAERWFTKPEADRGADRPTDGEVLQAVDEILNAADAAENGHWMRKPELLADEIGRVVLVLRECMNDPLERMERVERALNLRMRRTGAR